MQTIRRPKMRDQVSEQIKQYIVEQKLAPGDRLPTERQLAETFGISRLSVREVTKTLEVLGIVESKPGVGLTVGRVNMQRVTEHLGFHAGLLDADPQQLIDSRVIIETGVLPYVARRMADDPSIEEKLRSLAEQFGKARDLKACIAVDVQFHHALIEASGLQPLVAFGDLLSVFFQRFREAIRKVEWKVGVENHRRLVDLLAAGRVDAAVAELREQIESNKERL
ncbi:MAG: FadR family transcriptional regulator [Planctomycetes bacterium]|nr:FadR family transcriptional regulator [Planctomycetota bacterium]